MKPVTIPARHDPRPVTTDGVLTGNDDLADTCQWQPPQGEPERPLLPGHEHDAGKRHGWRDAA